MSKRTLRDWLDWIQSQHKKEIDLGLTRVAEVGKRMKIDRPNCRVITVGGTNGKGSCVAGLEAIYREAGYKVGAFVSPILFKHNEYVRIDGVNPSDEAFCEAFERVEAARQGKPITFFEFNALAAFDMFMRADLDVWILEVGLGGRLDAVNIIDADVAVVATVAIDHADWLGSTRELIGYEKAGIFRKAKPAVCGDKDAPLSLREYAKEIGTALYCQGEQFGYQEQESSWSFWCDGIQYENLPRPQLAIQNMATVLMALQLLQTELPVTPQQINQGFNKVTLPGRIQKIAGPVSVIYDVSHNPAAAEFLAEHLRQDPVTGKTHAVFSMLGDKDVLGTLQAIQDSIDSWHIAELTNPRAASLEKLLACFQEAKIDAVKTYESITQAYQATLTAAKHGDRVVIFGSFGTVSSIASTSGIAAVE